MSRYDTTGKGPYITLRYRMILNLADRTLNYKGEDSPRFDKWSHMTNRALFDWGLIEQPNGESALTERGVVWAQAATHETVVEQEVRTAAGQVQTPRPRSRPRRQPQRRIVRQKKAA